MSTKRTRSFSPRRIVIDMNERHKIDSASGESTVSKSPPMPTFDAKQPNRWFFELDKWFSTVNIIDSGVKFSLVAASQTPSDYAMLKATVRESPNADPYELARDFILRQTSRIRIATNKNLASGASQPSTIKIETQPDVNQRNSSEASAAVSAPTVPTEALSQATEISQSLQQLEAMLLTEIRTIKFDIAELQALIPNRPRPSRPIARILQGASSVSRESTRDRSNQIVAPVDPEECWYHQTYGRQARLCRAPCRHRAP